MKIEFGKQYVDQDGDVWDVLCFSKPHESYPNVKAVCQFDGILGIFDSETGVGEDVDVSLIREHRKPIEVWAAVDDQGRVRRTDTERQAFVYFNVIENGTPINLRIIRLIEAPDA
jgi:hypothetical protein